MYNIMKEVCLYTDGACRGNPGPGGYGAILVYGRHEREISGGEPETTNNRMELMAAIAGLEALKEPCAVTLYSDSKYLTDAFLLGWVESWREAGWRRGRDELKNPDLWERLYSLTKTHEVSFVWVKGHAGHEYNERCDKLATGFADSFITG
ncbi:MAG: ribonuclease HI [Clostridia bacterium]|nr:ribonuclease HI [Clostridia bacterium]